MADPIPAEALWRRPFDPLFRNGHAQTIVGRYWPVRLDERRWPTRPQLFSTEPDVKVLAHWNRHEDAGDRPTVLAVHGLTASSCAPYMRHLAQTALSAGFDVARLNVRNCGGTERLCPTLYHSGLTSDLNSVVSQLAPTPLVLVGFSMGGNMVLKLAGEWGDNPPDHVRAVCGISVPIRLGVCARRLGEPGNRIYEKRFLRELRRAVRIKRRIMSNRPNTPNTPNKLPPVRLASIRSIYEFDDVVTAPAFGFRDADDYYEQSSAAGFVSRVRTPALILQAQDDPFIPFDVFSDPAYESNPFVKLVAAEHGGHVAFLARGSRRFWAVDQAVSFFHALVNQPADARLVPAAR